MPMYLISYDLHRERDYPRLYDAFDLIHAVKLLESVWLAELVGPAAVVRDLLAAYIDANDSLAVIELAPRIQWATILAKPAGSAWLLQRAPFYD